MTLQFIAPNEVRAAITLPTSKSISNRALLIAALCGNKPTVVGPALCDDTAVMVEALSRQGGTINVGAAGTAMRFLTAYFATREGVTVTLGGVERMRQRPIGILVDALRSLGAHIEYLDKEGFPPLRITGSRIHGGDVVMDSSVSSQFTSAVMMILPTLGGGTIHLTGNGVSMPYIHMTAAVMRDMGATVDVAGDRINIGNGYTGNEKMKQWCLRVSAYAQRLLDGLDNLHWTDSLKETQRNWIGRSEGTEVANKVSEVMQKGYMLNSKVIRPSMVKVAQ